jgi:hypothetical protein
MPVDATQLRVLDPGLKYIANRSSRINGAYCGCWLGCVRTSDATCASSCSTAMYWWGWTSDCLLGFVEHRVHSCVHAGVVLIGQAAFRGK